jgi:hypothetical protein
MSKPDLTHIAKKSDMSVSYVADAMGLSMDALYQKLKHFYAIRRK